VDQSQVVGRPARHLQRDHHCGGLAPEADDAVHLAPQFVAGEGWVGRGGEGCVEMRLLETTTAAKSARPGPGWRGSAKRLLP